MSLRLPVEHPLTPDWYSENEEYDARTARANVNLGDLAGPETGLGFPGLAEFCKLPGTPRDTCDCIVAMDTF